MGIKRVAFAGHDSEVDWLLHVCVVATAAGVAGGWCCWLIYPCIFFAFDENLLHSPSSELT